MPGTPSARHALPFVHKIVSPEFQLTVWAREESHSVSKFMASDFAKAVDECRCIRVSFLQIPHQHNRHITVRTTVSSRVWTPRTVIEYPALIRKVQHGNPFWVVFCNPSLLGAG